MAWIRKHIWIKKNDKGNVNDGRLRMGIFLSNIRSVGGREFEERSRQSEVIGVMMSEG